MGEGSSRVEGRRSGARHLNRAPLVERSGQLSAGGFVSVPHEGMRGPLAGARQTRRGENGTVALEVSALEILWPLRL